MESTDTSTLVLFDVDGTLTAPRKRITPEMEAFLEKLKKKVVVGLVGGSDLKKISEQMDGGSGEVVNNFKFVFSENGLVAHKDGKLFSQESLLTVLGEEVCQEFINYALKCLSEISLPCKRGTFIEFRSGLINVCPVGRSCSQAERDAFGEYDKKHQIREGLVAKFKEKFPNSGLVFAIGGQISMDVYPEGWDKRYCLKHLQKEGFKTIHFFGDKTAKGGNDHELFEDPQTIGHTVTNADDTMKQCEDLFF